MGLIFDSNSELSICLDQQRVLLSMCSHALKKSNKALIVHFNENIDLK